MVEARTPTDPLQATQPIVDAEGKPTQYFMRQWLAQQGVNLTGSETTQEIDALSLQVAANLQSINDLVARNLTAGTGLNGGGDLSADRTFDLADTDVTPGTFGNATNVGQFTVDQQGRVTAAANVAIAGGSGGSSVVAFPVDVSSTFSGSAFASKGSLMLPYKAITVTDIVCRINANTAHTYKAGIYALNSSRVIQAVLGESVTQVPPTTGSQYLTFPVASLIMAAGTLHYVGVTRTDSTTTFALPIGGSNEATGEMQRGAFPIEVFPTGTGQADPFGRLASVSPAVSETVLSGTGSGFMSGAIGTF